MLSEIANLYAERSRLFSAMIELNTTCNWRCRHCYIPSHTNKGMQMREIERILYQLREAGVYEITLTGGEIFLREDILDIIQYARQLGFSLILFTNMSLITEDIMGFLQRVNITLMSCTIFSMDECIHDAITGVPGSLKKALKGIALAQEHGIPAQVKTIIMGENCSTYSGVEIYCRNNDLLFKPDIAIFSKTDGDKSVQDRMLNNDELLSVVRHYDKAVGYESSSHDPTALMCPSVRNSISIDANGDIFPCNRLLVGVGNVSLHSVQDIWETSELLKEIQSLRWSNLLECINCKDNQYCVRCAGAALLEDGDMLGKSLLACRIAQARRSTYMEESTL